MTPVRREIMPLVELLARAALEAIRRGEFEQPRKIPEHRTPAPPVPDRLPAA